MDAFTFGSSVLLCSLIFSEAYRMPVKEIHYNKVLEGFGLTSKEFIDLSILLGCDYCVGIGQKRAAELLNNYTTQHKFFLCK